ncbi:MAG TPA: DUF2330 domain-containing protein [Candidatus Eisenbacteria bacterium]
MRNRVTLLMLAALLVLPSGARAMCSCFPCDECQIVNSGQATFIMFDREGGTVRLIPNILITGPAASFALIVPTPTVPELAPVDKALWSQLSTLTQPPVTSFGGSSGGPGCSQVDESPSPADNSGTEIIATRSIGSFIATTIHSSDPRSLVSWLFSNGFEVTEAEAQALARYVSIGWYFTAMKLDPESPESQVPDGGWFVNVNPVEFRYAADRVDVPLDLLGINRSDFFPVRFYVVDDHRRTLEGYQTNYANQLSEKELDAMGQSQPLAAGYLAPGRFLTRLERTYGYQDVLEGSLPLVVADSDEEVYWPDRRFGPTFPLESLVFLLLPAGLLRRRRER